MSSSAISPLTTPSALTDRVYESVRNAILTLELPPGSPVVERELAARFAISKSPVRDALQRLVGEGLLEVTSGKSLRVLRIDHQQAESIYELREVLERMAVRLATPRLTDEVVKAARDLLERSAEAIRRDDPADAVRLNREFHAIFSRLSGNQPLAHALDQLHDRVRLIAVLGWQTRPSMHEEHEQHLAVLDAAASGDARLASRLMAKHISASRRRLRSELPAPESSPPRPRGAR